jgi:HPt (histidine-containing phosphotransfer) domain-containing protein
MVDYELNELRREFLAEAEEKVREIETSLEGERTPESLERLAYLAHQLKGSGGSYGYQSISNDATEVEKGVEHLAANGAASGIEEKIRQHVVNLRTEIERALSELATAPA